MGTGGTELSATFAADASRFRDYLTATILAVDSDFDIIGNHSCCT